MGTPYADAEWLRERQDRILTFYYPTCIDDDHGGYIAQLDYETGEIYDADSKHLVATSRFVVNFALGARVTDYEWARPAADRGVGFLRENHRDPETGDDWLLRGTDTVDDRRVCYGHAFVLLAYARAHEAGVDGAKEGLEATDDLLVDRFWEPEYNLCKSEFDAGFTESDPYRGQNANMHTCEAMLAAFEATGDGRYLDRAREVAHALSVQLAAETDGLLWEHYTADWNHDFEYNREEPRHQFRPWGYQPGHHIEWARLLAVLDRYSNTDWALDRAEELFEAAIEFGWDDADGGFYYTVDREGEPIVENRHGWPVAEGIGAAAALAERTDDDSSRAWDDRFWNYAEDHLTARRMATGTRNSSTVSQPKPDQVPRSNRATIRSGPASKGCARSTTRRSGRL